MGSEITTHKNPARILHLFTLCAFAIGQPILTALSGQAVYLHDQKFGLIEISLLLVTLFLLVPLSCVVLDRFARLGSQRIQGWGSNSVLVLLTTLLLLSLIRPYATQWWAATQGSSGLMIIAFVIPCSWGLVALYQQFAGVRVWLTVASLGLVIFPVHFLWNYQRFFAMQESMRERAELQNPIPVVLIVFDEFSGITLMNERGEIDKSRFPQFARLAKNSTWYRNATTVSPRTDIAVPAILSGQYPATSRSPLAADYPGNLLERVEASQNFEMAVFEPVSRLGPATLNHQSLPERFPFSKSIELLQTLAAVYPRLIFTTDTPIWFPIIPKPWFGIPIKSRVGWEYFSGEPTGLFHYPGTEYRVPQQQHFLKCLQPTDKPLFCFFHTVFPHYPWVFLSSGEQYQSEFAAPSRPSAARGELGEDWDQDPAAVLRNEFRYRLQVGAVDHFVGQLLDRLEVTGLFNRCLLVVTADHGVSFRPGHSRRLPDALNGAEIFSVPLFVKYPAQTAGSIDDRNVESIDIYPTIAEVLGIELPDAVEGIPLSAELRRGRKTIYFEKTMTILEPDFPQRQAAIQRQFEQFGHAGLDLPPVAMSSHPDWHGLPIDRFVIEQPSIVGERFDLHLPRKESEVKVDIVLEPRLVTGSIEARDLPEIPAEVILVIDGIVRDTSKTYWIAGSEHGFQFLIPHSVIAGELGSIELYLASSSKPDSPLRLLRTAEIAKRR
jgi:hypothetical protein